LWKARTGCVFCFRNVIHLKYRWNIMAEQPYGEHCKEMFDPDKHFEKKEALDDIKVLDIANYILGPEISQAFRNTGSILKDLFHVLQQNARCCMQGGIP
jgi:hypothetical protein